MNAQTNNALRRVARTAIQIVAGLSVTTIMQVLGAHIPAAYLPMVLSVVTFAIAAAQNYAEAHGLMPIIFANAHPGTTPPPAPTTAPKV